MTPEELEAQEKVRQKRKKHHVTTNTDTIDWEEGDEMGSENRTPWGIIGFGVIALTLFGGGAAYLFKQYDPETQAGSGSIVSDEDSQAILDNILRKDESEGYLDADGNDISAAAVDQYHEYDMAKVEEVVKAFLNSDTVEERIKYSRQSERVLPLMKSFYDGNEIEAEGYETLNKSEVSYRDTLLTALVQTADFLTSPIAVERLGDGEDAVYVVDWESWVGYCEVKPEVMRLKKPTDPMLMRVLISSENYYNYGFSDDRKWRSYRMEVRNSEYVFLGYAKRDSEADKTFTELRKEGGTAPYLIKVAYPPKGRASDQVEILEVVTAGWIIEEKASPE